VMEVDVVTGGSRAGVLGLETAVLRCKPPTALSAGGAHAGRRSLAGRG